MTISSNAHRIKDQIRGLGRNIVLIATNVLAENLLTINDTDLNWVVSTAESAAAPFQDNDIAGKANANALDSSNIRELDSSRAFFNSLDAANRNECIFH